MSVAVVLHLKYNPWSSGIARSCKVCKYKAKINDESVHIWTGDPEVYDHIEEMINKEEFSDVYRCNDPISSIILVNAD